jgi:hypothetical protein
MLPNVPKGAFGHSRYSLFKQRKSPGESPATISNLNINMRKFQEQSIYLIQDVLLCIRVTPLEKKLYYMYNT